MSEGYTFTRPFTLTCPECGGALFPPEEGAVLQYACHIGHRLTWPILLEAQLARIEASLGTVMVLMKERAELARQLAEQDEADADTLQRMVVEALNRAEQIKTLLELPWIDAQ
jgi:two-component system chemotaxis response regulator CheB